jgi:hypothetical protein
MGHYFLLAREMDGRRLAAMESDSIAFRLIQTDSNEGREARGAAAWPSGA